eukprot:scaffold2236_cov152-Skeletonema_menzelii.AAC.18
MQSVDQEETYIDWYDCRPHRGQVSLFPQDGSLIQAAQMKMSSRESARTIEASNTPRTLYQQIRSDCNIDKLIQVLL